MMDESGPGGVYLSVRGIMPVLVSCIRLSGQSIVSSLVGQRCVISKSSL